jgi:hypothetical protein
MLNHFLEDIIENPNELNLLDHTLATTRNITGNFFMVWFTGGLNYQIEHHLFTTCPIENLYKVSKIVKDVCNTNNLIYKESSLWETTKDINNKLKEIEDISREKHRTLTELICLKLLNLLGWRVIENDHKIPDKCILIGYPHTSYYDFFLLILSFSAMKNGKDKGLRYLITSIYDFFPINKFIKAAGGIFVEGNNKVSDTRRYNQLNTLTNCNNDKYFKLHIAPEGRLVKNTYLQSGFYVLGMKMKLPIVSTWIDAKTKTLGWGTPYMLTGDVEKDISNLWKDLEGKTGIVEEYRTPFIMNPKFTYKEDYTRLQKNGTL